MSWNNVLIILLNKLIYCFSEDKDNYLLKSVLGDLKVKYEKIIVPDSLLNVILVNKE